MKKIIVLFTLAALGTSAESLLDPVNEQGFGTVDARVQSLSMFRDYEGNGDAWASTLGLRLGYTSPELAGFSFGLVWDYVEPVDANKFSNNGKNLLANGRVNLLTEAWMKYHFGAAGLTNTFIKVGRQVVNGEVFRADEVRHQPRSLEALTLTTKDIPNTTVTVGHAWRLSNWINNGIASEFRDIDEVLGGGNCAHGITWAEAVYTGITNLEVAVYDAYAQNIANVAGGRVKYTLSDTTALNGYYRHENQVGDGMDRDSDMFGASIQQKIGSVTLEPGFLSICGDGLLFQETTTGINHPLGSSMMIYAQQFEGGSDTFYLKVTTKIGKTGLYALYNYTMHDRPVGKTLYDGQELNVVVKQPIGDRLSVALKVGAGYRDIRESDSADDMIATDARVFVTYNF